MQYDVLHNKSRIKLYKLYSTSEQLQNTINEYFNNKDKQKKPYTLTGLYLALGLDNETFNNYIRMFDNLKNENEKKEYEYFAIIKNAKEKILESHETQLLAGTGSTVGTIFYMKNNYNYKDKNETDINLTTSYNIQLTDDEEIEEKEK